MKVPKEPQSASQRTAILRASSYLPWSQTTQVPFRSCEAYFGNGFTNRVDLLKPKKDLTLNRMGWFKCWFSETLRMDPEKIKMSRGGEILEEVIGRGEEEELPEFQTGAFQIDGGDGISGEDQRLVTQEFLDEYVPHGAIVKHTMRELIGSVRIVPTTELQCNESHSRKQPPLPICASFPSSVLGWPQCQCPKFARLPDVAAAVPRSNIPTLQAQCEILHNPCRPLPKLQSTLELRLICPTGLELRL